MHKFNFEITFRIQLYASLTTHEDPPYLRITNHYVLNLFSTLSLGAQTVTEVSKSHWIRL